jgi:hypothetical protein
MKFTDLFIKRPVLAVVVNLVILIAGLQAIRSLSVRQYPRSDIAVNPRRRSSTCKPRTISLPQCTWAFHPPASTKTRLPTI